MPYLCFQESRPDAEEFGEAQVIWAINCLLDFDSPPQNGFRLFELALSGNPVRNPAAQRAQATRRRLLTLGTRASRDA